MPSTTLTGFWPFAISGGLSLIRIIVNMTNDDDDDDDNYNEEDNDDDDDDDYQAQQIEVKEGRRYR